MATERCPDCGRTNCHCNNTIQRSAPHQKLGAHAPCGACKAGWITRYVFEQRYNRRIWKAAHCRCLHDWLVARGADTLRIAVAQDRWGLSITQKACDEEYHAICQAYTPPPPKKRPSKLSAAVALVTAALGRTSPTAPPPPPAPDDLALRAELLRRKPLKPIATADWF